MRRPVTICAAILIGILLVITRTGVRAEDFRSLFPGNTIACGMFYYRFETDGRIAVLYPESAKTWETVSRVSSGSVTWGDASVAFVERTNRVRFYVQGGRLMVDEGGEKSSCQLYRNDDPSFQHYRRSQR